MSLAVGSRLGPYEILAPLGAGGMGEVYRAKDAKLGREIAVKVLPSATASDPDRRQRFEQEARSASALNHPNILTVYDIGEADGTTYIAMELIEGKTLRDLIAADALPTKKLLDIAVQTAEGLAKAHAAGIVHRDLKPENLMVSKDGYVKILDFGLAKLTEPVSQEQSALPTAIASPTQPGTVMGTAGYMSPEQAGGQLVDFRSDQFTLGSILYEMATGKKAFQRKTGAETLVAIIREEPEPLTQAAPKAPAPVRWIVERCLAKDPEERYASTKDLARDLKSVRDHLSETSVSGALEAAEPAKARRRRWLLPAALALAGGIGLGFWVRGIAAGKPNVPMRFQQLTFQRGSILTARFAPDGQTIVYSAAWDGRPLELFSTRADSTESRSLGLPSADILSISSTGEMAISLDRHYTQGFETAGTLARVPLGGGTPRPILEDVEDADWSPDGKELAVARHVGSQRRLEYPIGKVLYEASGWVSGVCVSPDGRLVAFVDHPERGDSNGFLKVVDTKGKVRLTGPFAQFGVTWSPRGDEVWTSPPVTVTSLSGKSRIALAYAGQGSLKDIARDGRALFTTNLARREIVGMAQGETQERNLTWLNWSFPSDISPDGKAVLFDEQQITPVGIYIRKLDGSPAVRIGEGRSFGFSPDGKWVLITRKPGGGELALLPTGAGEPRPLPKVDLALQWANWFPDGRRILISGSEPGRGNRLFVQNLPDGGPTTSGRPSAVGGAIQGTASTQPRAITPEGVDAVFHAVSPDGKSVIAQGPDRRTAVYPIQPGEPRPVPGMTSEDLPIRWTADGRSMYVLRSSETPSRIDIVDVESGRHTPWKEFRPPDPAGVFRVGPAQITPDGKAYVYSYRRLLEDLYLVTGLK